MSEIVLHPTSANCITPVPNYFIDYFMNEADGEYVKIFLYLLRSLGHGACEFSIEKMADSLEHTEKDVRKALHYWQSKGLLTLEYSNLDELCGIYLTEPGSLSAVDTPAPASASVAPPPQVIEARPAVTVPVMTVVEAPLALPAEPALDSEMAQALYLAEKLIGKTLSSDAINTISTWHDSLGLPWSLVEYIIDYCVNKGSYSIHYMDKVASNLAAEGIRTVDEARQHNNAYLSVAFAVKSAFGISGRNLGQAELEFVNKWTATYGFSTELITEACKRTLLAISKPGFEYADTILSVWHDKGVKSLEDVEALDKLHAEQMAASKPVGGTQAASSGGRISFITHDYDYDSIESTIFRTQGSGN